jgi:16S rRNA (uracil1498-N3)-methyltransferase
VTGAASAWAAAYPATGHVLLDELADDARVEGDDGHHLSRVRRIRPGEALTAADGAGVWRPYEVVGVEGAGLVLRATAPPVREPELTPRLEVAFALTKGAKPETVVQQLTELGVDRIRPVRARRSVVRWDASRAEAAVERMRRVAREAVLQCRRARLPVVDPPVELAALAGLPGLVLGDPGAVGAPLPEPPGDLTTDPADPTTGAPTWTALVGPEGGFEPDEIARLGVVSRVGVGPHVLRAQTAAVAVAAALAISRRIRHC